MSGKYRGVLRVSGSALRGWLIDVAHPARRVAFHLLIDDEPRGLYVADTKRRFFVRRKGGHEDTHGFTIPLRRAWISGKAQIVRLVDPSDAALDLVLSAKLGPRAHEHFAEHVSGGQVSIGTERIQARDAEDDTDPEPRAVNKVLLRQLGALSDTELVNLLFAVDRDILAERLTRYDKTGDWERLAPFRRIVSGGANERMLLTLGRGAMKAHSYALAGRVTAAAAAMHPSSFDANYLAGAAKSLQGEFDDALRYLRLADRLEEGGHQAKREMAIVLSRQLRQDLSAERREQARTEHLAVLKSLSITADIGTQVKYRVPYATALYAAGRYDEAIEAANLVLATAPNDTRALMVKARALVARNAILEARALYERVLDLDPSHRGARMNLRILAALAEDEAREREGDKVSVARGSSLDALKGLGASWICVSKTELDERALATLLAPAISGRLGYAEIRGRDGRMLVFWRREALLGLVESGLIASLDDAARFKRFYRARPAGADEEGRGLALLTSRNGAELYGGGEHFLKEAAEHHARQGFEVVIVGTRADLAGRETAANGHCRSVFIGEQPADLRRFVLENDVRLVHAISGMGFAVAEALDFTNIPFIYGVHFWNELLGDAERTGYFDDVSGGALFRREFLVILSRAAAVYANSRYTQKIIEDGFGVRCPILYASPRELPPPDGA